MNAFSRLPQRWVRLSHARDAGGATAELVLAVPVLVSLIMLVISAVAVASTSQSVRAAADEALEVARVQGGSDTQARTAATDLLSTLTGHHARDVRIRITRTATRVHVRVTASTGRVLGIPHTATADADGPIERLTVPTEGR